MAKVKPYPEKVSDWRDTDLWDELKKRDTTEAEDVRATLIKCMPGIQTILDKAATSPEDFTLHDADHSGRVAQNMAWLMPSGLLHELSNFELALLLLSAYLHDIGMTPEQKKVENIFEYLLRGNKSVLDDDEFVSFQEWLDEIPDEIEIPVPQANREALSKARFIIPIIAVFGTLNGLTNG